MWKESVSGVRVTRVTTTPQMSTVSPMVLSASAFVAQTTEETATIQTSALPLEGLATDARVARAVPSMGANSQSHV